MDPKGNRHTVRGLEGQKLIDVLVDNMNQLDLDASASSLTLGTLGLVPTTPLQASAKTLQRLTTMKHMSSCPRSCSTRFLPPRATTRRNCSPRGLTTATSSTLLLCVIFTTSAAITLHSSRPASYVVLSKEMNGTLFAIGDVYPFRTF